MKTILGGSLLCLFLCSAASHAATVEDAKITAFIVEKVAAMQPNADFSVQVKTENRNVTFTGLINSMEDAHHIVEVATPLSNVNNIDISHLQIKNQL